MPTPVLDPVSAVQAAAFRVALRQRLVEKYGLPSLAESWKPFCPLTPTLKQAGFLALDCREALYGGAATWGTIHALHAPNPPIAMYCPYRRFHDSLSCGCC